MADEKPVENKWKAYQDMCENVDSIDTGLDKLVNEGIMSFDQASQVLGLAQDARKAPIHKLKVMSHLQLINTLEDVFAMERSGARSMEKLRAYLAANPSATPQDYVEEQTKLGKRQLYTDWGLTSDQMKMYSKALGL